MTAKKQKNLSGSSTQREVSMFSQKNRPEASSDPLLLTPSEIESLRKHKKKISAQVRGRFDHLFQKLKKKEPANFQISQQTTLR